MNGSGLGANVMMPQESGKALLFDIDGTLADTDALHLQAFNRVFGSHGHVFDRARAASELMRFSNTSIGARFLPDAPPRRQAAIMAEKEAVFRELVAGNIQPVPGLMPLLARADRAGIATVGIRTSLSHAELVEAGARITASSFEDPELIELVAATMN